MFTKYLTANGWTETTKSVHYTKIHWQIIFDTSSWIEVGTKNNTRIFDMPVPKSNDYESVLSHIEQVCEADDQLHN
ncbi:hypothetical protein V202x_52870 [Gimesia aquarii]|uniref:Uncharacterized protein n=1 Tax=Gimesia aquarii TaxID=2527964 RepID=A0A517X2Z3_9PLAN|nr:hypothetical protein V202x_52870 [Gimesia aquarii]